MAEYENILYEKQRKGVAITLNRPSQMNSFNQGLRADLHAGLDEADADPEIRYIILTGAGRAFSAGADMSGNVMDGGPENCLAVRAGGRPVGRCVPGPLAQSRPAGDQAASPYMGTQHTGDLGDKRVGAGVG